MEPAAAAGTNGISESDARAIEERITSALESIHNPRTSNDDRARASQTLNEIDGRGDAPYVGFVLARNHAQKPAVRHFALSLLENFVRQRWTWPGPDSRLAVREWILELARTTEADDPPFIRNKVAQLWVEVATRSWALEWIDMDERLVQLWSGSVTHKMLALEILETLSENSFGKEDTVTALRGQDLSRACVEIFTPAQIMIEHFPKRETNLTLRHGDEGWLERMSDLLDWCMQQDLNNKDVIHCVLKLLTTFRSVAPWAILVALAETHALDRICKALFSPQRSFQLAAIETLHALFGRHAFADGDIRTLVIPMLHGDMVRNLQSLYEWSIVDAQDIDDDKYLISKKLAELVHTLGKMIAERAPLLADLDLAPFSQLLINMLRSDSLHVSIPILHLWVQLLSSPLSADLDAVRGRLADLLELCSQRLIRYELLPSDSEIPSILFLHEDLDTVPERHAFLGNYARFCRDVVDHIVRQQPSDALSLILSQAYPFFEGLAGQQIPDVRKYNKSSMLALRVDSSCNVVEAGLQGYQRWRTQTKPHATGDDKKAEQAINQMLQDWAERLLLMQFEDPTIQQRIMCLTSELATGPLRKQSGFVTQVVRHILMAKCRVAASELPSDAPLYLEAVREFQRYCSHQLQRIAARSAQFLVPLYKEIESCIDAYCQSPQIDNDDKDRLISILMIIVQRASSIDEGERASRLESFIAPTMQKWQDPSLSEALQSFDGFCQLLSLSQILQYFQKHDALSVQDWSQVSLDEEGLAIKANIETAQNNLPLRSTKTYLAVSIDRHEQPGQTHGRGFEIWSKHVPVILPRLLDLIRLSHLFSDASTWQAISPDAATLLQRVLKDRFWQVGISSGSRDDFYSQVERSKTSLEGLASAVRGCLRFVRETSYKILGSLSLLGDALYAIPNLAGPLSQAIFEHAGALSTHQANILIDTMRPLIEGCPAAARTSFLAPVLIAMFDSLDAKITREWHMIDQRNKATSAEDNLVDEMKDESILRQLSYQCVTIVVRLLDPHEARPAPVEGEPTPILREFILSTPNVFKSVILFCTHALEMHDSRSCGLITRVLRSLIGVFGASSDPIAVDIREFLSTEVFKACITSLHDPYFVDVQADLAQLIASIARRYAMLTPTPRRILASLPGVNTEAVDDTLARLVQTEGNSRMQRALVLKLLENVRGVSLSEQGRLPKPDRRALSALQAEYTRVAEDQQQRQREQRQQSPDLGGVADMFA